MVAPTGKWVHAAAGGRRSPLGNPEGSFRWTEAVAVGCLRSPGWAFAGI